MAALIFFMASPVEHTHHIKIRSTHSENLTDGSSDRDYDYDRKLRDAQEELDRIQLQREELERKKIELEALAVRKRAFLGQQAETMDKLTASLELIDQCLLEMKQEREDLEQCRGCFVDNLELIKKISPETWSRENQVDKLEKATHTIEIAIDEYDQAAIHFAEARCGSIFGRPNKRAKHNANKNKTASEFGLNLRNGFAFNLPILILGGTALVFYIIR